MSTKKAALIVALGVGTVLDELAKLGAVKAEKGEAINAYTVRVCEAVGKLSDAQFETLTQPAKDYFNTAAAAINDEKEPPAAPAVKAAKAKIEVKAKGKAPAAAAPAAAEAKPAAAKGKIAVKAKPAAAAKPEAKARGEGVAHKVREMVVNKPDIEFEKVATKLGVEAKIGGHAWNIYNEAKRVMEIVAAKAAA